MGLTKIVRSASFGAFSGLFCFLQRPLGFWVSALYIPIGSIVVPFCGFYLGSYKVIPILRMRRVVGRTNRASSKQVLCALPARGASRREHLKWTRRRHPARIYYSPWRTPSEFGRYGAPLSSPPVFAPETPLLSMSSCWMCATKRLNISTPPHRQGV